MLVVVVVVGESVPHCHSSVNVNRIEEDRIAQYIVTIINQSLFAHSLHILRVLIKRNSVQIKNHISLEFAMVCMMVLV